MKSSIQSIAIAGALVGMLAIGFMAGRASMPAGPPVAIQADRAKQVEAALERVAQTVLAVNEEREWAQETPWSLACFQRTSWQADLAELEARAAGATEEQIQAARVKLLPPVDPENPFGP